jgi:hypothetical protein
MINIKNFLSQLSFKGWKTAVYLVGGFLFFVFVFQLGVVVGYKKASFSYRLGEEYHRSFNGPKSGMMPRDLGPQPFFEAHGAIGKIINLDLPTLVVQSPDGSEKLISITSSTIVRQFRDDLKISDLKLDDIVVVVGAPNEEGRVEAKLIRVMPPIPENK